jgi:hypothetical protein
MVCGDVCLGISSDGLGFVLRFGTRIRLAVEIAVSVCIRAQMVTAVGHGRVPCGMCGQVAHGTAWAVSDMQAKH